jgi:hypothetical protein
MSDNNKSLPEPVRTIGDLIEAPFTVPDTIFRTLFGSGSNSSNSDEDPTEA